MFSDVPVAEPHRYIVCELGYLETLEISVAAMEWGLTLFDRFWNISRAFLIWLSVIPPVLLPAAAKSFPSLNYRRASAAVSSSRSFVRRALKL